MKKILHISAPVSALLAICFLTAGCRQGEEPLVTDPLQVAEGPVRVSLTMSLPGFGTDDAITKADYVDVAESLRYAHEKQPFKDYAVFVFDATDAFKPNGNGDKYEFDPAAARYVGKAEVLHSEHIGDNFFRNEFKLDKPYKSLAVLVLANMGEATYTDAGIPSPGAKLDAFIAYFSDADRAIAYETDQSKYIDGTVGLPVQGFKVFGSWEGLSVDASDDDKKDCELMFYKGMSTPLTVKGFQSSSELDRYAGANGTGAVRESDRLVLQHSMARLHFQYIPKAGQPAGEAVSGQASVEITGVYLHNYTKKVRVLPESAAALSDRSPFTPVTSAGDRQGASDPDVKFVHPPVQNPSDPADRSWIAYVPELRVEGGKDTDPWLVVEVKVTDGDGKVVNYIYAGDKVTRKWTWDDNGVERNETAYYVNSPWMEWLRMRTHYPRKMPDGTTDVALGSYYNLVRNYSYEWIAEGVEGMKL